MMYELQLDLNLKKKWNKIQIVQQTCSLLLASNNFNSLDWTPLNFGWSTWWVCLTCLCFLLLGLYGLRSFHIQMEMEPIFSTLFIYLQVTVESSFQFVWFPSFMKTQACMLCCFAIYLSWAGMYYIVPQKVLYHFSQGGWANERKNVWKIRNSTSFYLSFQGEVHWSFHYKISTVLKCT